MSGRRVQETTFILQGVNTGNELQDVTKEELQDVTEEDYGKEIHGCIAKEKEQEFTQRIY